MNPLPVVCMYLCYERDNVILHRRAGARHHHGDLIHRVPLVSVQDESKKENHDQTLRPSC